MDARNYLEIEAELIRLSHRFAYHLDSRQFDELIALFTPEGIWGRILVEHHGREEIRAAMTSRPTNVVTRHVATNFHFTHIDATRVRGVVYTMTHHGPPRPNGELPGTLDVGHSFLLDFHDLYKKTAEGWRFAERIAKPALLPSDSPMWKAVQESKP